ncbi:hypothetical protein J5N97_024493 [Dioscorea zingiberensis]|uniref:ALOG domain-containing protein n=1 Tax=Dioscorea zingiberensis TaxID=325984 RepID=A0A9D5H8S4_9LILI|nr:hypothetical protein J5N97_024493 [Dioscorea zingiberensis]
MSQRETIQPPSLNHPPTHLSSAKAVSSCTAPLFITFMQYRNQGRSSELEKYSRLAGWSVYNSPMDPYVPTPESPPPDSSTAANMSPLSTSPIGTVSSPSSSTPSRYESQKRRDWNTFGQYLRNHRPPLPLARCSGAHVLEFLRYLDQFGKTKVHLHMCPFFGHPNPPSPCPCPLRQAWGSLDALVGRLRAAYEENGGRPENNPFGARAVRLYLREVRETQSKARGISYEKKKRKKPPPPQLQAGTSHETPPSDAS